MLVKLFLIYETPSLLGKYLRMTSQIYLPSSSGSPCPVFLFPTIFDYSCNFDIFSFCLYQFLENFTFLDNDFCNFFNFFYKKSNSSPTYRKPATYCYLFVKNYTIAQTLTGSPFASLIRGAAINIIAPVGGNLSKLLRTST